MAILIEVNGKPKQQDIILYDNGTWKAVSKHIFLSDVSKEMECLSAKIQEDKKEIESLHEEISSLKEALKEYSNGVNATLEKHHDVLKILVGGK